MHRLLSAWLRPVALLLAYGFHMVPRRSWADEALTEAVKAATSWRAVQRALGLNTTSVRHGLRRRADELGLNYARFTGSDDGLEKVQVKTTKRLETSGRYGVRLLRTIHDPQATPNAGGRYRQVRT